jgi:hypothetical protein
MARYPSREYTGRYGNLVVSVKWANGYYVAKVVRPLDGYEVTIETIERSRMEAVRYALWMLAETVYPRYLPPPQFSPALKRARAELAYDAQEALIEISEQEEPSQESAE